MLSEQFPDSMYSFSDQQELKFNYQDSTNYFKILFQDKLFLLNKNGKQLSAGFDNIKLSNASGYFETESIFKHESKLITTKGLVDSTGLEIIKCKYKQIVINKEDSSIYCCSAVFNNKLNDDVYNYKGKIIYSNRMHIEHSSNTIHVMKSFEKNGIYFIENSLTNEKYQLAGERFYYLKNNIAFFINNDHWFTIDLTNKKKQKIDKASYFFTLFYFIIP